MEAPKSDWDIAWSIDWHKHIGHWVVVVDQKVVLVTRWLWRLKRAVHKANKVGKEPYVLKIFDPNKCYIY